jgi:hypothetical protein
MPQADQSKKQDQRLAGRAKDWTLKPGSESARADHAGGPGGPELSAPCEGFVEQPMTLQATVEEAAQVPRGPCTIEQSEHRAVLRWTEDGEERRGSMPIEDYRERLAAGTLRRCCDDSAADGAGA